MDEKNGKNPFLALTVATMLFAAMGVMVYTQAPYKGIRPSVPEIWEPSGKVKARLWQDPFQAVLDYDKAKPADKKPDLAKPAPGPQGAPFPCISITKPAEPGKKVAGRNQLEKRSNRIGSHGLRGAV